eukprot:759183-Pyramimonas_sp.AAC.1
MRRRGIHPNIVHHVFKEPTNLHARNVRQGSRSQTRSFSPRVASRVGWALQTCSTRLLSISWTASRDLGSLA